MAKISFLGIGLQNFGPFRERQYLDLRTKATRPIVLVKALNGSGKTTLLTALQVVLYGAKLHGAGRGREYEKLILSLLRRDARDIARIDLDLRLEGHGEVDDFTVSRSWSAAGGKLEELLNIHRQGDIDPQLTEDWDSFLNNLLPAELVQLFLFDGEKIEALANPETLPDMLRRATEAFLGIGGIDSLSKDLVAVERRALIRSRSESAECEAAKTKLATLEQQHAEIQTELPQLAGACASSRNRVDQLRRTLEGFESKSERSGLVAYEQAAELRAAEQQAKQRVQEAQAEVREALADPWSAIARLGNLWTKYELLYEREDETRAAKQLLAVIQKRDQRIIKKIGSTIPGHALATLREVLNQDQLTYQSAAKRPLHLQYAEPPSTVAIKTQVAAKFLEQASAKLELAQQEFTTMERRLSAIPQGEQVSDLLAQLQTHAMGLALAEAQLQQETERYQTALDQAAHLQVKIKAATEELRKEFGGLAHEAKSIEASVRARGVLSLFKDRLMASKAHWLSNMITNEFAALMRKRKLVSRVQVDPDTYAVTIVAPDGHELPMARLSAGERQLLAISVLSALIRERKGHFPVAVDTPLARLDTRHRRALVQRFFSKISHQVMVLSTDEEIDNQLMGDVSGFTSKAYVLEYSDDSRCTTVHDLHEEYLV